jgi:putative flippase GtrA
MKRFHQFAGAGLSGAVATGLDITTLVLLVERGHVAVPLAAFCAATVGAVAGFLMNKHVAFRDRSRVTPQQLVRFGAVAVATALMMALAMKIVAVELGVPYLLAKLLCAAAIFAAWTYPAQRRLVFRAA